MKKWTYLVSGIVIGALVATSGSAFAAQVKSLVGQKVTEELKVVVNGKELADKGAVIDGKTNAPVRALSDALGAELKLEGKVITITTNDVQSNEGTETAGSSPAGNKYVGGTKASLETLKASIENNRIKPAKEGRAKIAEQISQLESSGGGDLTKQTIDGLKEDLAEYDAIIANANQELEQINEALNALKK